MILSATVLLAVSITVTAFDDLDNGNVTVDPTATVFFSEGCQDWDFVNP
ncbi:hypothetical protein [Rhodococcus sp. WMMA185]|nr:hypothetical protein [Rhodococcus sp. WMMA185]